MELFYTIIASITAGVSLYAGLINLFIGLNKDAERAELVFGLIGVSLFIFFVLPPFGFVLADKAPYPFTIIVKRIFMCVYFILFPIFIEYYTGFKVRFVKTGIIILVVASYTTMARMTTDSMEPLWVTIIIAALFLTMFYGFYLAIKQIRSGERSKGYWLLSAMMIYGLLLILGTINQFDINYFRRILGTKIFFPFNLNPLAFMLIMGVRLRANIFEKFKLEKILHWRDLRWNLLVQNMQLLIVELDINGNIKYLNPYAVKALGYTSEEQLLNKNWFDNCLPKEEISNRKSLFLSTIKEQKLLPYHISNIVSRDGKKRIINWTHIFVYNDAGTLNGTMSIGVDITEQENAFEQVKLLKFELEKESLISNEQVSEVADHNIIGQSEAVLYAIQKARQVAQTNATILLEGETGVGKELFADFIHKNSNRSTGPLIKINCAALPAELIESELFGHEKGAFTGAVQTRKGRFELADGGTIFLDEIGELPLALQPKLLRVLQTGEFERIGGRDTLKADVRIISATNRDLLNEVKTGHFREDLYFRLNVFPITIPALRNRKEDIPMLVTHFVKKFSGVHSRQIENVSKADMFRLCEYAWPGNIRELINVIERSIISSNGSTLKLDWLTSHIPQHEIETVSALSMEEVEKAHILKVLKECNWKINGDDGAAAKLGLHPNTLRSRLKKLNISRSNAL